MNGLRKIAWGSWYGDGEIGVRLRPDFELVWCEIRDAPALSAAEIRASVRNAIGSQTLREFAARARNAAIAVDDISRPTPAAQILPVVMEELGAVTPENIRIIMALGAHRPMIRQELEKKLGSQILSTFSVEQHHPYENLVDLGQSSRGTPISINRNFYEADLKITVGSVLPHPYMGFGGGAKMVVPGLAGIETLQSNHQPAVTGITGGLCNPDVEARKDVEEIGFKVGLNFTCNVVVNSKRQIAGLFCGQPVQSHREAVQLCKTIYATEARKGPYDILILNAYPKDTELLQAGNALNCLRGCVSMLEADATVVIATRCSTGRGYHSLHGEDMRLYRVPAEKPFLNGREVVVFSPNINQRGFGVSFSKKYRFFSRWSDVADHLDSKHSAGARVGIFPVAPLQIVS